MPAQYFTITISVKYLISFETLIQDLSENDKIINGPVAFYVKFAVVNNLQRPAVNATLHKKSTSTPTIFPVLQYSLKYSPL